MNSELILRVSKSTLAGTLPFPEAIALLLQAGVESYRVDFIKLQKHFFTENGGVVVTPLNLENLPKISEDFDTKALRQVILDSQQNGQKFREFSHRAMLAGVQSYQVFLKGKRVIYTGRHGNQHVEWFPNVKTDEVIF